MEDDRVEQAKELKNLGIHHGRHEIQGPYCNRTKGLSTHQRLAAGQNYKTFDKEPSKQYSPIPAALDKH
ncbi:hypothetical protein WN51_08998 [Melipona quadrifasciata]|uniref:Uncharacterized protein n=1 Tax=Melipona quadrifasciata TaxID=166423 RepID=A0A0N0U7A2_9HYME|nr:hypothetical protein WN51_08998 [Melipona quadrifasciata]